MAEEREPRPTRLTDDSAITYHDAGVDRAAAERAKHRISDLVRSTFTDAVVGDVGAFGGCFRLPATADSSGSGAAAPGPLLVASADGVGTKLKVAVMAGVHDTVGYDLVAHCADDILTQGAVPLFFLDYLALGQMDESIVEQVLVGLARGCRDVGAALIGGETAEMPDMYAAGEYDLAGFIVGSVVARRSGERDHDAVPLTGAAIRPGDALLGLPSNGLHTNGYTLVRKILFERQGLAIDSHVPDWGHTVADELLRTHREYVRALLPVLRRDDAAGVAHVTGGGIPGNLPRILPRGCGALVRTGAWEVPSVFQVLQQMGGVPIDDMWETFNMGLGMIIAVHADRVDHVSAALRASGERVIEIGEVVEGEGMQLVD